MIKLDTPREAVTKATKTIADTTVSAATKAKEVGSTTVKTVAESSITIKVKEAGSAAASTATETAKTLFEKTQSVTGKGVEKVSDLPLGDKKIGERAHETVETVQDKIDVEQIQEQVARLRDQIENVLGTWKESFRPAAGQDADLKTTNNKVQDEDVSKKKTAAKKTTTAKATTAKKTAAKKTTTAKATTAKKTAAKKTTTTKSSSK